MASFKTLFYIILVGILTGLVVIGIFIFFGTTPSTVPVETVVDKPKEELKEAVSQATDEFYSSRNYDQGIKTAETAIEKARAENVSDDFVGYKELVLANLYIKDHKDKGLELRGKVFNNYKYSQVLRHTALFDQLEYVSSQLGHNITVEEAREKIFSKDNIGSFLPEGTPLSTKADIYSAVRLGFLLILEENPGLDDPKALIVNSKIHLANQALLEMEEKKNVLAESEYQELFTERVSEAKEYIVDVQKIAFQRSQTDAEFNSVTNTLLFNVFRSLERLYRVEEASFEEVLAAYTNSLNYLQRQERWPDQKAVGLAVGGQVMAITELRELGIEDDFTKKISDGDKMRIAEEISHLINLDIVNKKRRVDIHAFPTKKDTNFGYKAFVYIANNIEPKLKDVLIDEIGGWKEEDFKL